MKSTREKVLQTLVINPRSTVVEIANAVGINAISVRHHLTNLQAENLVIAEEERHGVGRPRLVYFLTDAGQETFPKRYFRFTSHVIKQLKKSLTPIEVRKIFADIAKELTEKHQEELSSKTFEEKLDFLKIAMADEGYQVNWDKTDEGYEIKEVACPFFELGKDHPEICLFDKMLIVNILSVSEKNVIRQKHGDNHCSYKVINN